MLLRQVSQPNTNLQLEMTQRYLSADFTKIANLIETTRSSNSLHLPHRFTMLLSKPGNGKSQVAGYLCSEYSKRGVVVMVSPRNTLNEQVLAENANYYQRYYSDLNLSDDDAAQSALEDAQRTIKAYGGVDYRVENKSIVVSSINQLRKILTLDLDIALVIIDESHEATKANYRQEYLDVLEVLKRQRIETLLLTATKPWYCVYQSSSHVINYSNPHQNDAPRVQEHMVAGVPSFAAMNKIIVDQTNEQRRVVLLENNTKRLMKRKVVLSKLGLKVLVVKSEYNNFGEGSLLYLNDRNEWINFNENGRSLAQYNVIVGTNSIVAGLNFNETDKQWCFLSLLREQSVQESQQFIARARKQCTCNKLKIDVVSYVFTEYQKIENNAVPIVDGKKKAGISPQWISGRAIELTKSIVDEYSTLKFHSNKQSLKARNDANLVNATSGLKGFDFYSHLRWDDESPRAVSGTANRLAEHLLDQAIGQCPELWYGLKHGFIEFSDCGKWVNYSDYNINDWFVNVGDGEICDSKVRNAASANVSKILNMKDPLAAREQLMTKREFKRMDDFTETGTALDDAIYRDYIEVSTENSYRDNVLQALDEHRMLTAKQAHIFTKSNGASYLVSAICEVIEQVMRCNNGTDLMAVDAIEIGAVMALINSIKDELNDSVMTTEDTKFWLTGVIEKAHHICKTGSTSLFGIDRKYKEQTNFYPFYSDSDAYNASRFVLDYVKQEATEDTVKGKPEYKMTLSEICTDFLTKYNDPCAFVNTEVSKVQDHDLNFVDGMVQDKSTSDQHHAAVAAQEQARTDMWKARYMTADEKEAKKAASAARRAEAKKLAARARRAEAKANK